MALFDAAKWTFLVIRESESGNNLVLDSWFVL